MSTKIQHIELLNQNWKLDKNHVAALLKKLDNENSDWKYKYSNDYIYNIGLDWQLKVEEIYGGREGDGEDHWIVIKLADPANNETFWMIPGYYESYNGSELEFDNVYQVVEGQKVVRSWNKTN